MVINTNLCMKFINKISSVRFVKYLDKNDVGKQNFWNWLNIMFNKVDEDRLKLFGPDRTCAEWILRNGGAVRLCGYSDILTDYNGIPPEGKHICIEEVDATESSIMHVGFEHFKGCRFIKKIILHKCGYLEDKALGMLGPLKESLEHLQVSSCLNISDLGLMMLGELKELRFLVLYDLPYVEDKKKVLEHLQNALSKCKVQFGK